MIMESLYNRGRNSEAFVTFSLLPITSSHSYASAPDSTCDYWR